MSEIRKHGITFLSKKIDNPDLVLFPRNTRLKNLGLEEQRGGLIFPLKM